MQKQLARQASADQTITAHVRWMIRRDLKEVFDIEDQCFDDPWSEYDFVRMLRRKDCIGMVAEWQDRVAGFMVYSLSRTRICLENFAVDPEYGRRGVGTRMLDKLKGKLSAVRRRAILVDVSEKNLRGHLFFKAQEFMATRVLTDHYCDGSTAYRMEFWYRNLGRMGR